MFHLDFFSSTWTKVSFLRSSICIYIRYLEEAVVKPETDDAAGGINDADDASFGRPAYSILDVAVRPGDDFQRAFGTFFRRRHALENHGIVARRQKEKQILFLAWIIVKQC